jgi:hypothetical protein
LALNCLNGEHGAAVMEGSSDAQVGITAHKIIVSDRIESGAAQGLAGVAADVTRATGHYI